LGERQYTKEKVTRAGRKVKNGIHGQPNIFPRAKVKKTFQPKAVRNVETMLGKYDRQGQSIKNPRAAVKKAFQPGAVRNAETLLGK
jgi:hypothetical protein